MTGASGDSCAGALDGCAARRRTPYERVVHRPILARQLFPQDPGDRPAGAP